MSERRLEALREVLLADGTRLETSVSARLAREVPTGDLLWPVLQTTLLQSGTALVARRRSGGAWGLRLGREEPAHLIIGGPSGCGKSELLRTCLVSLCWSTAPGGLGVLAIDPSGRQLGMIGGLPHALLEPVSEPRRAAALLGWLMDEVRQRHLDSERPQSVVLAVEDTALWREDPVLHARLSWLRRFGGRAGIHVLQIVSSGSGMRPIAGADTRVARGQRCPGDFIVLDRDGALPIHALWLPVRDLVSCLDEIRQRAWLAGAALAARGGVG